MKPIDISMINPNSPSLPQMFAVSMVAEVYGVRLVTFEVRGVKM